MGYCPSQDWDRHVAEEDRQAEARAAFFTAHADKIATVAAGLAQKCVATPFSPSVISSLVKDAANIVGEIVANGNPPEDEGDIFDGPQPAGGSTQEEQLKAATAKIVELEAKLEERTAQLKTMTGYRDSIVNRSEHEKLDLQKQLGEALGKAESLGKRVAEAERQRDIARESKEAVSTWVEKYKAEAKEAKAKVAEIAAELAESRKAYENCRLERSARGAKIANLTHRLEAVARERDSLKDGNVSTYARIAGAWYTGRLGRVGLFGKTVAFTVAGRKDEPFTVRTFEVEKIGETEAYRQALALALGEGVEVPASRPTIDEYREGFANLRDAVLNQRYQLADYLLDSDTINAVLGLIDDNNPETNRVKEGGEA